MCMVAGCDEEAEDLVAEGAKGEGAVREPFVEDEAAGAGALTGGVLVRARLVGRGMCLDFW